MGYHILLVNPNRFKDPPVIPIGLEYIVDALEKANHHVDILDLCFSESPEKELTKALFENSYNLVGFSIRNIDSLNNFNNEFFLPSIKPLIQCVKKSNIPVLLGGSGFSAMPYEILDFLGADYGIIGPGEIMFPRFLKLLQSQKLTKRIYDGWEYGTDIELIHLRGHKFNYTKYSTENEIMGFETQKGCVNQCPFCIKAGTQTWYKKIPNIIKELSYLVDQGYTHFRCCDSEFNSDLDFAINFCRALLNANLPLKWTLFIKPRPYNEEFFRLLHETNVYNVSLNIASDKRIQELNNYTTDDIEKIIEYCEKYEIELSFDLFVGYPYESLDSIKKMINFFKNHRPTEVTIDLFYRVYGHTVLADLIKSDPSLQKSLIKPHSEGIGFLEPVFYNSISLDMIKKLISEDPLFDIAWLTPEVSYQQV
ncbi:MAG: B12-binding domain-containing radical SAM protein [Promethearchaeota archaeon]|jgi:radical SAM superfamily enzyme YgiQ (UPF0313 family)